ncbi:MAG: DcaP family trimeric outer membrane transporter, partial [Gammaproteobacteria bacterium]
LKVYLEGDFFTGDSSELVSNSRHFRLRHAYGKMGNLLIGQTWSTFMDANWVLYPSTVDFAGPAGATFIRQSILRWTVSDGLDFALENPENRVDGQTTRDTVPDVILRYASAGDLSWQIAGLFQQFEIDGGAFDGQSESNIGITGGVAFKTASGSVSAKFNSNSNRYTYYGFGNPAAVIAGGTIEPIDHTSIVLAWNHNYGGADNAKTTVAFGQVSFDDEFLGPTDIDTVSTIHVNYRWSPRDNVNLGVEVINADREDVNGDDGDATRIQFGAQFTF